MLESAYQAYLINRLKRLFPGAVVLINDPETFPGIPDLLVLWRNLWAVLEVKPKEPGLDDFEPNQEMYIAMFDHMSFGACIYPENEEDVLNDLESAFRARG